MAGYSLNWARMALYCRLWPAMVYGLPAAGYGRLWSMASLLPAWPALLTLLGPT